MTLWIHQECAELAFALSLSLREHIDYEEAVWLRRAGFDMGVEPLPGSCQVVFVCCVADCHAVLRRDARDLRDVYDRAYLGGQSDHSGWLVLRDTVYAHAITHLPQVTTELMRDGQEVRDRLAAHETLELWCEDQDSCRVALDIAWAGRLPDEVMRRMRQLVDREELLERAREALEKVQPSLWNEYLRKPWRDQVRDWSGIMDR